MVASPRAVRRRPALLGSLALLAYVLAFVQRTGEAAADTRIELSADPGLFLERVFSVWSATTDFGHVQSGQFTGYLAPMAPYFAAGDALGVPMWILQRFWLGSLLLLAGWGVVCLMDELLGRRETVAAAGAALVFMINPYVVQFTSRGTVTLLTYVALPWLMLAVQRGLREHRGWRWPAVIGLLMAVTGGGVNAAVLAFALLGPLALLVYELVIREVSPRAVWSFSWRAALAGALGSAWWVIPLLLQSKYGTGFLLFTEQPRTIWGTTSLSELIRLLGFWGLYTGVGYGQLEPFMRVAGTYLFNPVVIVATFAVPTFAVLSLRLSRGWRYAPFFALLMVLSLLMMFTGFPQTTRLRADLIDLYYQFEGVQFLRTTYKAAPLLALSLACLSGAGAAALYRRASDGTLSLAGRRVPRWALAGLALIPVLAAAPLFTGRAIDHQQAYGEIPASWSQALGDADRDQPAATRTMVLPGELFGYYRWGGTMDPVGPALSHRGVAIREIVPYADARSSQLQIAVDDLVQQGRLVPGQLTPLLRLLDVGQVLVPTDTRQARSGALDPVTARGALAGQGLLGAPGRDYGDERVHLPPRGRSGTTRSLPEISRRAVPGTQGPGGVRLHSPTGSIVLEGDAEGVTELAAHGLLGRRAVFYAADLDRDELRAVLARGAPLVLSDSARRRTFVAARLRADHGPTLGPHDPISPDSPRVDPFPDRGVSGRTVAHYPGLRRMYSPAQPGFEQFPQYRPYAAVDGRKDTSWLADENVPAKQWYLHLDLARPRPVRSIAITPHVTRHGRTAAVWLSVNGGAKRRIELTPRRNTVQIDEPRVRSLRVQIAKIVGDKDTRGAGGIAELEIPGLRARERLRLPTAVAAQARGLDLSRNPMAVILERTTADFPTRAGVAVGEPEDDSPLAMADAETGLERELALPAARAFRLSGWATVGPDAPDDSIDRLAGVPRQWRLTSSSRFEGVPGRRASSAFDGDPRTAWVADLVPGRPAWLAWRAPNPATIRHLRLVRASGSYAFPATVRVAVPGQSTVRLPVGPDGDVVLPRPAVARSVRIEIAAVAPRRGAAERRHLRAVAIAEVSVPNVRFPRPRRDGRFATPCGELRASAARPRGAAMAVSGTLRDLDSGRPLRLAGCGPRARLALPAGNSRLSVPAGTTMRADHLMLSSPATRSAQADPAPVGRVLSVERGGPPGAVERATLDVRRPGWLALAQSYDSGWRAWCKDASGKERSLGAPLAIDGYANGWRVGPGCREARFAFGPQRAANLGFAVSGVSGLVMLAVVLVAAWRRRRRQAEPVTAAASDASSPPPDPPLRPGWGVAAALTVATVLSAALIFTPRISVPMGLAALVALRVGINTKRLVTVAVGALVLVPVIYLAFLPPDKGGFNFEYANELVKAHWLVAGVLYCLAASAGLEAWRLRARARRPD